MRPVEVLLIEGPRLSRRYFKAGQTFLEERRPEGYVLRPGHRTIVHGGVERLLGEPHYIAVQPDGASQADAGSRPGSLDQRFASPLKTARPYRCVSVYSHPGCSFFGRGRAEQVQAEVVA